MRMDRGTLRAVHRTAEGFVLFEGRAAKPGVLTYRHADGSQTRELIPADELHRGDSLATLGRKSLTLEHPAVDVVPDNVDALGVGDLDGNIEIEEAGGYVKIRGCIRRKDAIAEVDSGRVQELSPGYTCRIDPTPGVHPQFGAYDAIQRDRQYNHLALTAAARGGVDIRLRADSALQVDDPAQPGTPRSTRNDSMKPNLVLLLSMIGVSRVDSEDTAIAEATRILQSRKDAEKDEDDKELEFQKAKDDLAAAKQKADELQAKVDDLTGKKTNADAALVIATKHDTLLAFHKERAALEAQATAHKLDAATVDGLDNKSLRKAIVIAASPTARKDGTDEYYAAAFDMLAAARTDADPWAGVRSLQAPPGARADAGDKRFDGVADSAAFFANVDKQFNRTGA